MIATLETALLDLLFEIKDSDIRLIVGGGYGIYLKTMHVSRNGVVTLYREWPEPRSTNDLDLYLRPELIIQPDRLRPLAEALTILGYSPVPGAENYQFIKPGPGGDRTGVMKIDFLTGPESSFDGTKVRTDDRRARPRPSVGIHAHPANEALTLEKELLPVEITGELSSGESWCSSVFLPHPYTFLMMKLFAFKDRFGDENKDFGRYHALDMYTILATTTKAEWYNALEIRDAYQNDPIVVEAGHVIAEYFSDTGCMGIVRLKESPYYSPELQLASFMSDLQELFPQTTHI